MKRLCLLSSCVRTDTPENTYDHVSRIRKIKMRIALGRDGEMFALESEGVEGDSGHACAACCLRNCKAPSGCEKRWCSQRANKAAFTGTI